MHHEKPYDFMTSSKQAQLSLGVIPNDSDSENEGKTVTDAAIIDRMHQEQKRAVAPMQNPDLKPISDEELQSLAFHPEDEKYYPGEYRRWRFRFGGSGGNASASDAGWIPFYRLRGRQRLIVEMKLAPRICAVIRSRWPSATVRDFAPAGKFPVV